MWARCICAAIFSNGLNTPSKPPTDRTWAIWWPMPAARLSPLYCTSWAGLFGRMPYAVVDLSTHEYFQKQLAAGHEVRVRMDTAGVVRDGLLSHNVMGVLPGTCLPDEEIVVCAHYDSTLASPGACDNASGVDAMLRIAETLAQGPKLAKTVRFIAFRGRGIPHVRLEISCRHPQGKRAPGSGQKRRQPRHGGFWRPSGSHRVAGKLQASAPVGF